MPADDSANVIGITGGSSGIGLATAELFASHGWRIAIGGRDAARLEKARATLLQTRTATKGAEDDAILSTVVDVRDERATVSFVEQVVSQFGRIDAWVNSAGSAPMAPLQELTQADLSATWEVNCRAIYTATQALWRHFRRQRSGVIVNISSMAAVDPFPGFSLYGASKAWVNLFTQAIAAEGAEFGARAYAVCPGAVETPLLRRLFPGFPDDEALAPSRVAEVIAELVSPACTHPSGDPIFIAAQHSSD